MGSLKTDQNSTMSNGGRRGRGIPLRILVPSEYVGAIIGKAGQTIRNITTETKARVDVQGKENPGLVEKVIYIYGQPENCSNACKEILKVMQEEAQGNDKPEINTLKILAEDRFCGRVIGKGGRWIKRIQEETETRVTVAHFPMFGIHPDSVITIKSGRLDNIIHAESLISGKIRECYEQDAQSGHVQGILPPIHAMLPYVHGMYPVTNAYANGAMSRDSYQGAGYGGGGHPGAVAGGAAAPVPAAPQPPPQSEVCDIWVPNSVMGAIIGAQGATIKEIIRLSNAYITIEPKREGETNPAAERRVTVKGFPGALYKACSYIYDKLRTEGYSGQDEVRLRTAIYIPKSMVGRVIGKGGKNVQEIQRQTGAMIKLPEAQQNQAEETTVEIFGTYMDAMNAMFRVREVVRQGVAQATVMAAQQAPPSGAHAQYRDAGTTPQPGDRGDQN